MDLNQFIQQMSTPNTDTRNWLLGIMNQATSSGMQAMENVAGQRGWGGRSGVRAGAAADIYGQGLQQLQTGLVGAEQTRLSALYPALIAQAEMEQRQRELEEEKRQRSQQQWLSILQNIGGGVGQGVASLF
jgi:hypothetical protein